MTSMLASMTSTRRSVLTQPGSLSFRQYLEQEYSGPFIHGMGSYEILDMVRTFVYQGRRLDVGSGTASLFWILATSGNVLTTASDVEPEALVVLREFLRAPFSPSGVSLSSS